MVPPSETSTLNKKCPSALSRTVISFVIAPLGFILNGLSVLIKSGVST